VLIVLPPSEGKTAPAGGAPVELSSLAFADELGAKRERVLAALVRASAGKQRGRALKTLGLSPGQAGELERNAALEAGHEVELTETPSGASVDVIAKP
jgi:uncharacterized protein